MPNEIKPFAFVLMPFAEKFSDIYSLGIKHVAEANGVIAERVDEQQFSENMLERIYRQIESADFIVAEMTGMNANVFYEVGYAHAKRKPCALITQNASDIPFDLKHHSHVVYDGTIQDLRRKLDPKIKWLKEDTSKSKIETLTVEASASSGNLVKEKYWHYGRFSLTLDLYNRSERRSPEIEAIYVTVRNIWELRANGKLCPSTLLAAEPRKKKFLIAPSLTRIAPGAFSQEKIDFKAEVWSKFDGREQKDVYRVMGAIILEIATNEGTYRHDLPIDVTFEEFPF